MSGEKDHFEELRNLILESDRENYAKKNEQILAKLDELEKELNDPEKFAAVIQQSKAEIIDVLGPVMGKMIKKFISSQDLDLTFRNKSERTVTYCPFEI
jgi:hypothetical protein